MALMVGFKLWCGQNGYFTGFVPIQVAFIQRMPAKGYLKIFYKAVFCQYFASTGVPH